MASLRKAIDEYCKWCIFDDKSGLGNWRQQVSACTAVNCPLYKVRPRTSGKVIAKEPERKYSQNGTTLEEKL